MTEEDFDFIVERISPLIKKQDTSFRDSITVGERLAVTLRYLASGDSYASLMSVFRIGRSTICNIISETCNAIIASLKDEFLQMPTTSAQWLKVADEFESKWHFPNCCGALDGKHVNIQAPPNCGSGYFNYKKYNSIVLMGLVDANYKFLYVDIGACGRESDGDVFSRCSLSSSLEDNSINFPARKPFQNQDQPMPYVIVADDAFPLKTYIMKPFSYKDQIVSHKVFNYRLSRAQNVVENTFGICASRFRLLRRPLDLDIENSKNVVRTICVLHNFLTTRNNSYLRRRDVDSDVNGTYLRGNWRNDVGNESLPSVSEGNWYGRPTENALQVREQFMEYFTTPEEEVPWQYNRSILQSSTLLL